MLGPTDKGLGAADKGNWNKAFLLWDRRIRKELKVNAKQTGNGYHVNKPPPLIQGKITETKNSNIALDPDIVRVMSEGVPKERFLLPQTSYQDIGWCQTIMSESRPRSTITGLYNWSNEFKPRPRSQHPHDHHVGLVTLSGDFGHPEHIAGHHTDNNDDAVSTTSSAVHRQNEVIEERIASFQQWLPRIGQRKYFHPTCNSEISLYADSYVKSMACGPFSKTARMINR